MPTESEPQLDIALMQLSCIGCMICHKLAPELFTPNENSGLVDLVGADELRPLVQVGRVGRSESKALLESTRLCPTDSILVWDAEGRLLNAKPLSPYIRPSRPYRRRS